MVPGLLLAAMVAASPQPRASSRAEPAVYVPRLDRLSGLAAFLERAGSHSSLLRPSAWTRQFHPFLPVNPTSAESLSSAGLDPRGAATVSVVGESVIACASVRDAKVFTALADRRLAELGTVQRSVVRGVTRVLASEPGSKAAGYALTANQECSVSGREPLGPLLDEAARLASRPAAGPLKNLGTLSGSVHAASRQGTISLEGKAGELRVRGRLSGAGMPRLGGGGESPYGRMASSGLLFVRAHVATSSLQQAASVLAAQVAGACRACDRRALFDLAAALANHLTGHVLLRVDRALPGGPLRTPGDRYFALKHVYVAELSHPEEVDRLLGRLLKLKQARKTKAGYTLAGAGGRIEVGRRGRHLYLGNDSTAIRTTLAALPDGPGKVAHGLDFAADSPRLARTLGQVSLLDALEVPELAALFAAAIELGPLLAATRRMSGWADGAPGGAHRFFVVWSLGAARSSPPAARPPPGSAGP